MNPQTNTPTPPDAPQEVRGQFVNSYTDGNLRLSLPYDAQSRERIAEQMARAMTKVRFPHWGGTQSLFDEKLARAALTAIEPKENK